jgi:hypothetical protein
MYEPVQHRKPLDVFPRADGDKTNGMASNSGENTRNSQTSPPTYRTESQQRSSLAA